MPGRGSMPRSAPAGRDFELEPDARAVLRVDAPARGHALDEEEAEAAVGSARLERPGSKPAPPSRTSTRIAPLPMRTASSTGRVEPATWRTELVTSSETSSRSTPRALSASEEGSQRSSSWRASAGVSSAGAKLALKLALTAARSVSASTSGSSGAMPVSSIVTRTSPCAGTMIRSSELRCSATSSRTRTPVESMNVRPRRSSSTSPSASARACSSRSAVPRSSSPRSVRRYAPLSSRPTVRSKSRSATREPIVR